MRHHRFLLCGTLAAMLAIAGCGQSGSVPESAVENTEGGSATTGNQAAAARPATAAPRPAAPKFESIVLPAGTAIEVTVDQAVSSKTNNSCAIASRLAGTTSAAGWPSLSSRFTRFT